MALQQRRNAFSRYQLQGITETNVEIGRGSFAVVEEVVFLGLSCVGKCIHRLHYDKSTPDAQDELLARFAEECELLSKIRHPHIVQFLGVYVKEAAEGQGGAPLPVIVMERLHGTLASTIDRHGRLPEEISHPILRDVATGLAYLHARPIIHRDLSANNVLLATNMSAKISDLGVAKILDLSPARMVKLTTCPGTPSYMPPEALVSGRAVYTTKIDIFSYGNLMTHILSGEWPIPKQPFDFDPNNPSTHPIPISEAERREDYLRAIGNDHALMDLLRQCLSNNPAARPEASDILMQLAERAPQHPLFFTNRVEALQRISERVAENHEQVRLHRHEVVQLQREVEQVHRDIEVVRAQGEKQVQEKDRQLEQMYHQMDQHQLEVDWARTRINELSSECEGLRANLRVKEEDLAAVKAMTKAREREASAREEQHQRELESIQTLGEEEVLEKEQEIKQMYQRIEQLMLSHAVEIEGVQIRVNELSGECEGLKASVRAKTEAVMATEALVRAKEKEATAKDKQLTAVRQVLLLKERAVEAMRNEIAALRVERDAQKEAIAARDSQLRAKELENAGKESVLAMKESTIAQLRSQATMARLLNPQSKLKWERCTDMPGAMAVPHVVRINNDLYVGGGESDTHQHEIFLYNPTESTWSIFPKCPTRCFGLTELNGKLVLVGGLEGENPTSDVYTLEESDEWVKTLPPLPTARWALTVFRYTSFLIACGGDTSTLGQDRTCTTTVEVFDIVASQWYNADPLPVALGGMSFTIISDTCYFIGGDNAQGGTDFALSASLLPLVQRATAQADPHLESDSEFRPSVVWKELPKCPCEGSTAAVFGGCLLAIGGVLPNGSNSASVYLYSLGVWVRVPNADIPQPRYVASATQLANGDLIMIGGCGVDNNDEQNGTSDSVGDDAEEDDTQPCSSVFVASIQA